MTKGNFVPKIQNRENLLKIIVTNDEDGYVVFQIAGIPQDVTLQVTILKYYSDTIISVEDSLEVRGPEALA